MVFDNFNVNEIFLKYYLYLYWMTTDEDISFAFDDFLNKSCIPISKLVSFTTYCAPSKIWLKFGFISHYKNSGNYHYFLTNTVYSLVIH